MDMTKVPGVLVCDEDAIQAAWAKDHIVVPDELTIANAVDVSHRNARERGFWPDHAAAIRQLAEAYGEACEHRGEDGSKSAYADCAATYATLVAYLNENVGPNSPMVAATGIALIMSELAEALEAIRSGHDMAESWVEDGKPEGVGSEFADAVVRIADQCGRAGIDLNAELVRKMRFNLGRPYRHGGKKV